MSEKTDTTAISPTPERPSFRKLVAKPSVAIRAMIKGLRELPNEKFKVRMTTFGDQRDDGICYGCAATCAVLAVTGQTPEWLEEPEEYDPNTWETRFARALRYSNQEIRDFESAVDSLRLCSWRNFLEYYSLPLTARFKPAVPLQCLVTLDWALKLAPYEAYASQLEELGY